MKVQEACHNSFGTSVVQGEATMGAIESASHTSNKWKAILKSLGYKATSVAFEDAFKELDLYKLRLQACDILVTRSRYLNGKGYPILGIQERCIDLTARKEKWMSTPLQVSAASSHWPDEALPSLFDHLEPLVVSHESEIFRCILVDSCRRLFERLETERFPILVDIDEVSSSPSSATALYSRYRAEMEPYCGKKNMELKTTMGKLYSLWVTVDAHQVEREFDLARRELKLKDPKPLIGFLRGKAIDILQSIQAWKAIKAKEEVVAALPKVAALFQLDDSSGVEGYLEKMKDLNIVGVYS